MLSALVVVASLSLHVAAAPEWRFGGGPGLGYASPLGVTADAVAFGEGRIDDTRARVDVLAMRALHDDAWLLDGSLSAGLARSFVLDGVRAERGVVDVALSLGPSVAVLQARDKLARGVIGAVDAIDELDVAAGGTVAIDATLASIPVASLHARLRCTGAYAFARDEPIVTASFTFGAALRDEALASVFR